MIQNWWNPLIVWIWYSYDGTHTTVPYSDGAKPYDQWLMEEFGDNQPPTDHDESEGESDDKQELDSTNEESPQGEEDPDPLQNMYDALRSDCIVYDLATCKGGEWMSPQADMQQVQNALHEMC